MVNILTALKRPFTNLKRLLLGIVFSLPIPLISILTNPMAYGYAFRCANESSKNRELPKWEKYGKLWWDGVIAFFIGLIYLLPVALIIFIFYKELIFSYLLDRTATLMISPLQLINKYGFGIIIISLLTTMIGYLIPIAILNWVNTRKFSTVFDFNNIFKKVFTLTYFRAWLIVTIIGMVIGYVTLKFLGFDELNIQSLFQFTNLIKLLIFSATQAIVGFMYNVFTYTLYGEVLEELKKRYTTKIRR